MRPSADPTVRPRGHWELLPAASVLLLCAVWLGRKQAGALDDDWQYFLSVRRLLQEGRLMPGSGNALSLLHSLWGALFCLPAGLGFGPLRLSTMVLSLLGLGCFHLLLRRCGIRGRPAALAVLLLASNPLYLPLSFTFMTDVPFLAWMTAALYAYLRGAQEDDGCWLTAASLAATAAFMVRQNGLMLAVGMILQSAWLGRLGWRRLLQLGAAPACAALAFACWYWSAGAANPAYKPYFFAGLPAPLELCDRLFGYLGLLGLCVSPLALGLCLADGDRGSLLREPKAWAVAGALACWQLLRGGWLPYKGWDIVQGMLNLHGLGTVLLSGLQDKACGLYGWRPLWIAASAASLCSVFYLSARLGPPERRTDRPLSWLALPSVLPFAATLLATKAIDRYLLPLVPGALLACAALCEGRRLSRPASALGTAALLAFSLAGTADYMGWSEARWSAASAAVGRGVPPEKVFVGPEWSGLLFFERSVPEITRRAGLSASGGAGDDSWMAERGYRAVVSFSARPPDARLAETGRVPYWTPLLPGWSSIYLYETRDGIELSPAR